MSEIIPDCFLDFPLFFFLPAALMHAEVCELLLKMVTQNFANELSPKKEDSELFESNFNYTVELLELKHGILEKL